MIVSSVELLALPQLLLDQGELSLQETLLLGDQLQVQVQTAHALQLLQVEPASPPHTDAVEDEAAADVNLNNININNLLWEIPARRYRDGHTELVSIRWRISHLICLKLEIVDSLQMFR